MTPFDLPLLLHLLHFLPQLLPVTAAVVRTFAILLGILRDPLVSGPGLGTGHALVELAVEASLVGVALVDVSQLQASLVALLAADGAIDIYTVSCLGFVRNIPVG